MKITSCFLLLFFINHIHAQSDSTLQFLEELADEAIATCTYAGLSIGYQLAGEEPVVATAGFRDMEDRLVYEPTTENRIASISKTITAVAILQLQEQEKLHIDVPLSTYLPEFPRGDEITIRQLLHHTSGIGQYEGRETESKIRYPDLQAAASVFADRPLVHEPGTAYYYTTYGYVVLGLVIEKVSGMTYEEYLQEHIFSVAEMTQTNIEYEYHHTDNNNKLYTRKRNGKIKLAEANNLSNRIPGGGITSTVPDLLKFGQALMDGRLISEASLNAMCTQSEVDYGENNPYGMGLFLYHIKVKAPWGQFVGHGGAQTGVSSQLMLMPEQGISVIVLTNTSRAWQDTIQLSIEVMKAAYRVYSKKG
ncbi:MAG: serine hydrolase domain-containing protein [Bacteroidota bacterium]